MWDCFYLGYFLCLPAVFKNSIFNTVEFKFFQKPPNITRFFSFLFSFYLHCSLFWTPSHSLSFLSTLSLLSDTFASKVAATQDQYADASIGNVTGSNAVNVFLGIGVAWSVAAVYWAVKGESFKVDPGSLAFSVTLFTVFAFICMAVLIFRRRPSIGGELGGPRIPRLLTSLLFLGLWFLYILFSSLEAYCHIKGF